MDRKSFLSAIGLSTGALFVTACLGSCKKDPAGGGNAPAVDFTIDISQPAYAALQNAGGYAYANGVIIAKTLAGVIIAISEACTHEGATIIYQPGSDRFYCPRHGATYSDTGAVTQGPAQSSLKQYTVTVTGTSVRING
jgi:cytochrome b6-f complex iron-sulfur subunit